MLKKIVIAYLVVAILVIFLSLFLSLREEMLERNIAKINREIFAEHSELQKLKAEWNYLNNREYLRMLVNKYYPELVPYNSRFLGSKVIEQIPLKDSSQNGN